MPPFTGGMFAFKHQIEKILQSNFVKKLKVPSKTEASEKWNYH
jgi:hypothetical protein